MIYEGSTVEESDLEYNVQSTEHYQPGPNNNAPKGPSIPIFGSEPVSNWSLSQNTLDWFQRVADVELQGPQIAEISKSFLPVIEVEQDFTPPDIPLVFWRKLKNNSNDLFRQKCLLQVQKVTCLSLKALLTTLDSMTDNDPNMALIATAVQLICTANLQTSRIRRSDTSKFMKNEVKPNLFSLPVTHKNLFVADFETVGDNALKAQNSSQKMLFQPRSDTAKFMKNEVKPNLFSLPVTHKNLFGADFETVADNALKAQNSSQKILLTKATCFEHVHIWFKTRSVLGLNSFLH